MLNLCLPIVLAILFGDLFSAMATLLAVCGLAKLTDENGDLPKLKQALTADATAAMGAALLGTNTPVSILNRRQRQEAVPVWLVSW
jgi:adenine/guanine/hypoxanthine permease